ncbi:MAG: PaaI family thioesterase [Myxococcales bacterium]|nr:PaaI family thioesterase [Myxococcales bacterium]
MTDPRPTAPDTAQITAWLNARLAGFDAHMGLRFVDAGPARVVARVELGPQHRQPFGLVHGGLYAAVIEAICSTGGGVAVFAQGRTVVGLDNHTSFHRAARPGVITATATPVKVGRRTHLWRAEILDSADRLVATGQVRLMVVDPKADLGRELPPGELAPGPDTDPQ